MGDGDYRLQMIVILMGELDRVVVFSRFHNTASDASQVVCSFMEIPIV